MDRKITFGLPRMRFEAGERRDFLPEFVASLEKNGAQVYLEHEYGGGIGLREDDYRNLAPSVKFTTYEDTFQQDYVLVLRCPVEKDLRLLRPGACLITMAHYPTRPQRVELLRSLGVEVVSLDSLKDDSGRRLVENLRAVAWNGAEVAFATLRSVYPNPPGLDNPDRLPLRVTLLGSGAVGVHVVQAAIRYGNAELWRELAARGVPGVQVTVVDHDTTGQKGIMLDLLSRTDLLIDATQRPDPSSPVICNEWLGYMPAHAVLLDLSVDPYHCDEDPPVMKGIEGIPQGNLDQYVFPPDDPVYETLPECVSAVHRRYAVSCYSWPGIHPRVCMKVYGRQLRPLMRTLLEKGGVHRINPQGRFFERALGRAMLSLWPSGNNNSKA